MNYIFNTSTVFFTLPPDFMQRRNGKCLLLWSFIPYWLIVDEHMLKILTMFDGKKTVGEIIDSTFDSSKSIKKHYEIKIRDFIIKLYKNKILSEKPELLSIKEDKLESIKIDEITIALSDEHYSDTVLSMDELREFIKGTFKFLNTKGIMRLIAEKPVENFDKLHSIIKAATYKGLYIIIDFPLYSYNEDLIKLLSQYRVHVQINLDGPYPSLNDAIQGEGAFDRATHIIKILNNKKINTILNMQVSEHNIQEIESFLKLGQNLNVSECRIVPLKKIGKYKSYRPADYREILDHIIIALNKNPNYAKLLGRDLFSIFYQLVLNNERRLTCGAGSNQVFLGADGFVYPCKGLELEQFQICNARGQSIEEIWADSKQLQFLRKQFSVENSATCVRCVIKYWCRAGCKGETIQNTFKAHNPSISCKAIQGSLIDLFWKFDTLELQIKPKQPYC
ncbi:MAG: SPASM domain-containing protein [Vampirovibrionia bacterium]